VNPQATWPLWPIPTTGTPAALTPRTSWTGEWSSNSTNSSGIE
jgi:hypothetical protein